MIGWVLTLSVEVISVAEPLKSGRALPMGTPLSKNWTKPVGVPLPGKTALTVAVNVTLCPNTDGFGDDVNVVEVLALLTLCVVVPELPLKFESPA